MKRHLPAWLTPRRFEWLLIGFIGAGFLIALVAGHYARPYSSDDVSLQNIMQQWDKGEEHDAVFSTDTWLLKMPVYATQDLLQADNSRAKLFASSLFFNAILFGGLIYFIRFILSRFGPRSYTAVALAYLPIGWFLALNVLPITPIFTAPRITIFLNPNFRAAEIGMALILAVLFCRSIVDPKAHFTRQRAWLLGIVATLFTGVFIYNDPYFLYMLLVPALLLTAFLRLRGQVSRARFIGFAGLLCGAVVINLVLHQIATRLGFTALDNIPRKFIGPDQLGENISNVVGAHFRLFSADVWGQPLRLSTVIMALNILLLLLSVGYGFWSLKRFSKQPPAILLLIFVAVLGTGLYAVINVNSPLNDRYLVLPVFAELLLLASFARTSRNLHWKYLLAALFVVGILANAAINLRTIGRERGKANIAHLRAIDAVRQEGVDKGYAAYWDANISTYLSSSDSRFLQVVCDGQSLLKMHWLVNVPNFEREAQRSFYLYSRKVDEPTVTACTAEQLEQSIGVRPYKAVPIDADYTLYFYEGDIGRAMRDYIIE